MKATRSGYLHTIYRKLSHLSIVLLFFIAPLYCQAASRAQLNFPHYPSIANNVAFWEKIYSRYSLSEAVIHDADDVSKIYDVIPLFREDIPGAAHYNAIFQQHAKEKYRAILQKIAVQKPVTREEMRVAALFTGKHRLRDLAQAAENVRSQRGQKERFLGGVIHSGRYMMEIKRLFRSYNLPEELAYLPHVESSFNFNAYSKYGAAGIWQFTRSTGKGYLTIDSLLDERLDPILSAHAAAKYLQNSYSALGNWPLALTSYNYGLSGMLRAVNEQGNYENIFKNYQQGYFKFASKNFYSEFLAALKVAKRLENTPAVRIDPPQHSRYLTLTSTMHIRDVSKRYNLSVEKIQSLNPALQPVVVKGEKRLPRGYELRLPADDKIVHLVARTPARADRPQQPAAVFHHVKKGETVISISRHYNVPVQSLIEANNLDKSGTIKLRQKLAIPTPATKIAQNEKEILKISPRDNVKRITGKQTSSVPTIVSTKHKQLAAKDQPMNILPTKRAELYKVSNIHRRNGTIYGRIVVQPEESLELLKTWLGTTGPSLLALNGLTSKAAIKPGRKLLLDFAHLSPRLFEKKRLDFLHEKEEDFFSAFAIIGQKNYQVISGDTLWDICYNKFDVPLWLLQRYNKSIDLSRLNREQELIIPIVQQI